MAALRRSITIRRAADSDAAVLARLNRQYNGAEHVNTNVDAVKRSLRESASEIVFVAEWSNELVGFTCLQLYNSFCYERPSIEITELFVCEAERRQQVGSALVKHVVGFAEEKNALEINLRVNQNNEPATKFYDSVGFAMANHAVRRMRFYSS